MPLVRRVPKRGFFNAFASRVAILNVAALEKAFAAGEHVDIESLRRKSLLRGAFDELKILGNGNLTKKLRVSAHRFSKSAEAQIEKAGGEVIRLPGKKPVHA
jgi:large subunit ribosomal protein L15